MTATEQMDRDGARRAYRWFLAVVVRSLLAFGVGTAWDRAWHTRNPFMVVRDPCLFLRSRSP